jgi:antitoxin HicB
VKRNYSYPVHIEPDPDGGMLVTCPNVPEVIAQGADRDAALSNARQALAVALFGYLKEGRPLPQASASGRETIAPQASDVLKIAVVEAWMASGLSKSQFARMLDIDEARRILDPDRVTKAVRLEQPLLMLGRRLHIAVEAA